MSTLRERLANSPQLTVVCAGDSQVWGQGAAGWKQALPDFAAGELRRLPDTVPCFASMLGQYLALLRGDRQTSVINSGVGSTSVPCYLDHYWQEWVLSHKPDVVVFMSSINDWIADRKVSIDQYRRSLTELADDVFAMDSELVLVTESPILGSQYSGDHFYEDYINACRQVAQASPRIRLADANLRMKVFLADGDPAENARILFADGWHVSQAGHLIYLKTITDTLGL